MIRVDKGKIFRILKGEWVVDQCPVSDGMMGWSEDTNGRQKASLYSKIWGILAAQPQHSPSTALHSISTALHSFDTVLHSFEGILLYKCHAVLWYANRIKGIQYSRTGTSCGWEFIKGIQYIYA